jgi:hypothetical protein
MQSIDGQWLPAADYREHRWSRCASNVYANVLMSNNDLGCQLYKELELVRSPDLPCLFGTQHSRLAMEHGQVCQLRLVATA